MDREAVKSVLRGQEIELPSWAFGNSGTRFKVFGQPGVPRDPYEKIADAAQVHEYTGVAPRVSLHIPWDRVDDYAKLTAHADDLGVRIGAINSNLFQDDEYRLGSFTHPDRSVRRKAIAHHAECVDVMRQTGSAELKLWLPDGMRTSSSAARPEQARPSCSKPSDKPPSNRQARRLVHPGATRRADPRAPRRRLGHQGHRPHPARGPRPR
jgi:L-rhamnose isomerase